MHQLRELLKCMSHKSINVKEFVFQPNIFTNNLVVNNFLFQSGNPFPPFTTSSTTHSFSPSTICTGKNNRPYNRRKLPGFNTKAFSAKNKSWPAHYLHERSSSKVAYFLANTSRKLVIVIVTNRRKIVP